MEMLNLRSLIGMASLICALAAATEGAPAQIVERLLPFLAPASKFGCLYSSRRNRKACFVLRGGNSYRRCS